MYKRQVLLSAGAFQCECREGGSGSGPVSYTHLLFVMDDGWFGKRDSDNSGLGDWYVNEKKLGCTLQELSAKIHGLVMKFGIWYEPECVSEDSDLYRAHPCLLYTSRVNRSLNYGNDGYEMVFSRMREKEAQKENSEKTE